MTSSPRERPRRSPSRDRQGPVGRRRRAARRRPHSSGPRAISRRCSAAGGAATASSSNGAWRPARDTAGRRSAISPRGSRESAHEAPLVCAGRGGAAAVPLLRSRNDRPERRRRHARVSRRLRLVRRRRRLHDEAVPAGALFRRAARCWRPSPRSSGARARSSASTASRSTRRCSRRGISSIGSSGSRRSCRTSTCCIRRGDSGREDELLARRARAADPRRAGARTTCRGSRFPRATSSSCDRATRGRSPACSSTTGSICCRSPG